MAPHTPPSISSSWPPAHPSSLLPSPGPSRHDDQVARSLPARPLPFHLARLRAFAAFAPLASHPDAQLGLPLSPTPLPPAPPSPLLPTLPPLLPPLLSPTPSHHNDQLALPLCKNIQQLDQMVMGYTAR